MGGGESLAVFLAARVYPLPPYVPAGIWTGGALRPSLRPLLMLVRSCSEIRYPRPAPHPQGQADA